MPEIGSIIDFLLPFILGFLIGCFFGVFIASLMHVPFSQGRVAEKEAPEKDSAAEPETKKKASRTAQKK